MEKNEHPVVIAIVIVVHQVEIEIEIEIVIIHHHTVAIVIEMIIIIDGDTMIGMQVTIVDDIPRHHHREVDMLIDGIDIEV